MYGRSRVALVIPAWNEPTSIGAVLAEVPAVAVDQVLVVVSGPDDPTIQVARAHGAQVLVQQRPGYGAACATGARAALAADADVVAFLDGDYADPPRELSRLLAPVLAGGADLVLGCRDLSYFPAALPVHARLGNRLVLCLMSMLLGQRFADLPSFKIVRADALRTLDMREMTYGWTVEMLVKAARAGLRIVEMPVIYRRRLGGESKVGGSLQGSARAAAKLVSCVIRYGEWQPSAATPLPAARRG